MDSKKILFSLIENFINDPEMGYVEQFYGKDSSIKVHSIYKSSIAKEILIEVVVMLGEEISEETTDSSMVEILIDKALVYFYPNEKIRTIVRFEA